MIEKFGIQLF